VAGAGIVDWGLGERVARAVAGGEPQGAAPLAADDVRSACDAGLAQVLAYTGLEPATPIPPAETVTRAEWAGSNLAELKDLAEPLEARAAAEISLPGPLGRIVRSGLGAAGGVEAGVVVGYASRRVLGQYQVSLGAEPRPARMLLVEPNLANAARELQVDPRCFLLWVATHEQTHSVQFAAVPWLRDHVAGLLRRLIENAGGEVDVAALARLARRMITTDPRRTLREDRGLCRARDGRRGR
jgi:putative hydrolase